ncbi:hypothetical protein [Acinetobacter populi]|uniref:Uncharacterized protein n=1 Tax=Acinetobacter populi TaxID=1582270 RepID=A0A1Z9YXU7_9GAMM|nr:hypothetical protein [Acinetobacter populi]OUY07028.1 hypothetical protein CAP51_10065 [Acinetobacter populi]
MNAQAQFLTITPEQLKEFERKIEFLSFDVGCTNDILNQMGTLFCLIAKLAEDENGASIIQIRDLARLGHFTCDSWSSCVDSIEENVKKLSPLETVKA